MFQSLQVKWGLISTRINFVFGLLHELPNDFETYNLRKLRNIRKISMLAGGRA